MSQQSISPEIAATNLALAQANLDAFIAGLAALSEKHGITIGGCGCCDSPLFDTLLDEEKGGKYQVDGPAQLSTDGKSVYLPGNLKWSK